MPPRYAYWTILIGDEPTAFRSGSQEDLMPTLKRLQARHAEARMMWWQNGKLWNSRIDAQEAMRARGEMGRAADSKQRPRRFDDRKPEWRPKPDATASEGEARGARRSAQREGGKLDWKPKGEGGAPSFRKERSAKPAWIPKSHEKPAWKPKGSFTPERSPKSDWKPKSFGARQERKPQADWKPRAQGKLEWRPKQEGRKSADERGGPRRSAKREGGWVPKEEYKKSLGIEAKKDKNWRPGGEHKDPRQKYKDAKKAKWGRFKQTIKKRWEKEPPGKKKDS